MPKVFFITTYNSRTLISLPSLFQKGKLSKIPLKVPL
jgi:hypothetical protein